MKQFLWFCFVPLIFADTMLHQSDFTAGTYRITQSGKYILAENISFSPNDDGATPYESCWVESNQFESQGGSYGDLEFGLGFFAAITIETDNVEIDLNGYTLEQSKAHALLQRFFAVIELANSPFLSTQGPHTFTTSQRFIAARNVYIHNGVIGRSSHHGIHGNDNYNISLRNINFVDFEVAGVALNGVAGFNMRDCQLRNRHDIPVLGTFSSARFLQSRIDYLEAQATTTTLKVQGVDLGISDIKSALKTSINNVFHDVIANGVIDKDVHPVEYALFAHPAGVLDGNAYGVLLNKIGVAILGFPRRPGAPMFPKPSSDISIKNVHIKDIDAMIHEIVALKLGGKAVTDSIGAVVQFLNHYPMSDTPLSITSYDESEAEYLGNPVLNAQIFIAKAIINGDFENSGFDNTRNGILQPIIDWVEAYGTNAEQAKLDYLAQEGWQCNGDSMAHVQKGVVAFKIDASENVKIMDSSIDGMTNGGESGSIKCGDYVYSHPGATLPYYNGAHVRGFSFAGSTNVKVQRCSVSNGRSINGNAIGFDIFTDSINVDLTNCYVVVLKADTFNATAFHLGGETGYSNLQNYCAAFITAGDVALDVWDEEGVRNTVRNSRC